jgi:hypothetical protein
MSFFVMPAWQPPTGYRIPAWLRPPETMVPGIVPVELLLARTDTHAVLVSDLRAYPTGLEFALTARPHPDQLQQPRHDPDRPHRLRYRDLWLELRFADGQTVSTDPRRWPRTFETEQPDPPFLYYHGAGGSERGWRSPHWLWGLPGAQGGRASRACLADRPSIGRAPPGNQSSRASALHRPQGELGGNRLNQVAAQVLVPFDRVVHASRQPLTSTCQRGQDPTEPGTADAELGLDVSLELLVGHLRRMTAQDHQDLDGGWSELGHEPVGEASRHSARRWPRA